MIQLAHAATGALVGRHCTHGIDALVAGLATHGLMDTAPHGEVHDDRFELVTGAASLLLIGATRGWRSPVTAATLGSLLPDLEHLPKLVGIETQPIFPTHRWGVLHGWEHTPLALPAWAQATLGGAILGAIAADGGRRRGRDAAQTPEAPTEPRRLRLGLLLLAARWAWHLRRGAAARDTA